MMDRQCVVAGRLGAKAKNAAERVRAAELAAVYNLPGLRPKEVMLCVILVEAGKPLTRADWLNRAGLASGVGRGRTNGGRRNYVVELERRKLIVRVKRNKPRTGARIPDLYLPSGQLLEALASAALPQS